MPSNNVCMDYYLNCDPVLAAITVPRPRGNCRRRISTDRWVCFLRLMLQLAKKVDLSAACRCRRVGADHRRRPGICSDDARRFRAFDADSGEVLWEQILNLRGGFPMTYEPDGVQYLAIAAGGGVNYWVLMPEIRQRRVAISLCLQAALNVL